MEQINIEQNGEPRRVTGLDRFRKKYPNWNSQGKTPQKNLRKKPQKK